MGSPTRSLSGPGSCQPVSLTDRGTPPGNLRVPLSDIDIAQSFAELRRSNAVAASVALYSLYRS